MNPVNDLLQQGINAIRGGNNREGAQKLAQIVQQDPRNTEAWFWLAAATDDQKEAADCLRRVLKIDPNHGRAKLTLEAIERNPSVSQSPGFQSSGESSFSNQQQPSADFRLPSENKLPEETSFDSPFNSYVPPQSFRPEQPTLEMPIRQQTPPFNENKTQFPSGIQQTPPPPFGMPAWANQPSSTFPPSPPKETSEPTLQQNPYAASTFQKSGPNLPPPIFQDGGTGLHISQLDPAAANDLASAQTQPVEPMDINEELRKRLLNSNQPPAPPIQQQPQTGNAPVKLQKPPRKKTRGKKNLIFIYALFAFLFIFLAVAGVFLLLRGSGENNNSAETVVSSRVTTQPTTVASNTIGTETAGVISNGAGTNSPFSPGSNSQVITSALTGNTTLTKPGETINTTPVSVGGITVTTNAKTEAKTISPVISSTVSGANITPPAIQTSGPVGATTSQIPTDLKNYVKGTGSYIGGMGILEAKIDSLSLQPYKRGSFTTQSGNQELSAYLIEIGQLARSIKDSRIPEGGSDIGVVAVDYANSLSEMVRMIESYLNSGQTVLMDRAIEYYNKAKSDRALWEQVIASGYPYIVPIS